MEKKDSAVARISKEKEKEKPKPRTPLPPRNYVVAAIESGNDLAAVNGSFNLLEREGLSFL